MCFDRLAQMRPGENLIEEPVFVLPEPGCHLPNLDSVFPGATKKKVSAYVQCSTLCLSMTSFADCCKS